MSKNRPSIQAVIRRARYEMKTLDCLMADTWLMLLDYDIDPTTIDEDTPLHVGECLNYNVIDNLEEIDNHVRSL
jgi:hypothetical protein